MTSSKDVLKFPKGFLWGTATAGHQVEGNNKNSDWWEWETRHKEIENSGIACDHYSRFKEDFKMAKKELHNNAHRFSVEWARIEPSEGEFDEKEIEHYKEVLGELKKLKMKRVVTLFHFVAPSWFSRVGGFERKSNLKYFIRYVERCIAEFGDLVDYWTVINEPNVYVNMSYLQGEWPPQKASMTATLKVFINLAKVHRQAYKKIHEKYPNAMISSTISMLYLKGSGLAKPFLPVGNFLVNYSFPFFAGKKYFDFMAVNYYFMHSFRLRDLKLKGLVKEQMEKIFEGEHSDLAWPIYPVGLYELVRLTWKKYKRPILITENGIADAKDTKRAGFIVNHLSWLHQAISEGVDIRGYIHWSLMDNFEWSIGRKARFGLYKIDYKTLERVSTKGGDVYGKICKANGVSSDLLE